MLKITFIIYFNFYYLLPFFSLNSYIDAILIGIPWQTLIIIYGIIFFFDIHWHSWYLTLTCYYFKLRLSYLHRQTNDCHSVKNAFTLMKQLNLLHLNIYKSNYDFWCFHHSEFLFEFIFMISFPLYSALFTNANFICIFTIYCFVLFCFVLFSIFLIGPSLVAQEASNSYLVFLKHYIRLNRKGKISILEKIKVKYQYFFTYNYNRYFLPHRCLITSFIFHQRKFHSLVSICLISTFKLM